MRAALGTSRALGATERRLYAREVHGSATLLAVLLAAWGAISLPAAPWRPFGPVNLGQLVVGAVAAAWFVATRARPRVAASIAFSGAAILYSLVLLPWTAIVWAALGRPWEAYTVPQVGIVCMALVAPRSRWVGIGLMLPFFAEGAFAYYHARHLGLLGNAPPLEPFGMLLYLLLGVGVVIVRGERRRLALRHIHVASEASAIGEVTPLLSTVRAELDDELSALGDVARRPATDSPALAIVDRSVERLRSISGRLALTVPQPTSEGEDAAEQRLRDRDAHVGALVMAAMVTVAGALAAPTTTVMPYAFLGLAAAGAVAGAILVARWRRPSERLAIAFVIGLFAAVLPIVTANQRVLLATHHPFTAFLGHKLLVVLVSLVVATRLRLGLALVLVAAIEALVTWFALGLGQHRDQVSIFEPWNLLVFVAIGIAIQSMHEQRRVASMKLLRAEAASTALHRRAMLVLALRDQINSPLQSLLLAAASLGPSADGEEFARMRARIDRLLAVSRRLAQLEIPVSTELLPLALDSATTLRPTR